MMIKVMESEQRSSLLERMMKAGLVTNDIQFVLNNQKKSSKSGSDFSESSRVILMKNKLKDSKKDEHSLRVERRKLRKKLEEYMASNPEKLNRIMLKLKRKVSEVKTKIKKKNCDKIKRYKILKEEKEKLGRVSSLPEEVQLYANLRVFKDINIPPEEPKPPVIMSNMWSK